MNDGTDRIRVSGITAEQIGQAAWRAHLPVYELTPTRASLEEAYESGLITPGTAPPPA